MDTLISNDLAKAAKLLKNGSVVGVPTETVYGLGASIYNANAIDYIFELKKRPRTNPLIVHISSIDQLSEITTEFPELAQRLATTFWPGSLTMVLPKSDQIPNHITANKSTVAVRIPNHPIFLDLINLAGPIAAPSANPYERISPTTSAHVANYFPKGLPLIVEGGACKNGIESTIVGFEKQQVVIYRLGSISIEEIESVVGKVKIKNQARGENIAPGMSQKHYAPTTKTILTSAINEFIEDFHDNKIGVIRFKETTKDQAIFKQLTLAPDGDFKVAASNIYAFLHELDRLNLDFILIEPLPNIGIGLSINDRLKRATHI